MPVFAVPWQQQSCLKDTLALLELYRTTLNADYLQKAIQRSNQMVELFEDKEQGGYFMTASDGELLIARPKETYDGAIILRSHPADQHGLRPHPGNADTGVHSLYSSWIQ